VNRFIAAHVNTIHLRRSPQVPTCLLNPLVDIGALDRGLKLLSETFFISDFGFRLKFKTLVSAKDKVIQ